MQAAQATTAPVSSMAAMHSRDESPVVTMSSTMATLIPGSRKKPRRSLNAPPSRST